MSVDYGPSEAKAWAFENIKGIISAPCLPESRDGEIDEEKLRRDVRHIIDVAKADGIYFHGFYGAFWLLTSEERRRSLEVVIDEAAGAVPVSARVAHQSLKETIALAQHAEQAGAAFLSVLAPWLGGGSEEMVVDYVAQVAAATNLGISLFNTRQSGYVISPELMARLAEIPNVVALKNHISPEHTAQIRALVGDAIVVIDPDEEIFLENIRDHGQQAIYTCTNLMFDREGRTPMRDYVSAALAGDFDAAQRSFDLAQPARDLHRTWVLEPWGRTGLCPISTIRTWTGLQGMSGGPVRHPLPELSDAERERLERELADAGVTATAS